MRSRDEKTLDDSGERSEVELLHGRDRTDRTGIEAEHERPCSIDASSAQAPASYEPLEDAPKEASVARSHTRRIAIFSLVDFSTRLPLSRLRETAETVRRRRAEDAAVSLPCRRRSHPYAPKRH